MNAESSGSVKGVNSARVVAEMRDIKTDVDASFFEVPTGYAQVAPEKVRQQIDALTSAVAAILKAMMANNNIQKVTKKMTKVNPHWPQNPYCVLLAKSPQELIKIRPMTATQAV